MKWTISKFIRHTQAAVLIGLIMAALPGLTLAVSAAETNAPPRWPPLAEVLKKWGEVSLADVQKAAEGGDLTAQHYLGYSYAEGLRGVTDGAMATQWYLRAGAAGYLPSYSNLGLLYQSGKIVPMDSEQMIHYFKLAADGGFVQAEVNLGVSYRDGKGIGRDPAEAVKWFHRAANHGHIKAMVDLYYAYWRGSGVASDRTLAMQWLTKAAEADDPAAQYLLGCQIERGGWKDEGNNRFGPPPNASEAARWYLQSATQNLPEGEVVLGYTYLEGGGIVANEEQALTWFRKAADQGNGDALFRLSDLYAQGIGEPRNDQDRAFNLLLRAAAGGKTPAYRGLSYRYENGLGVNQDLVQAAAWRFRSAAAELTADYRRNDPVVVRAYGKVKPTDAFSKAILLIGTAATGDDATVFKRIANMYANGDRVPKDPARARFWAAMNSGQTGEAADIPADWIKEWTQAAADARTVIASMHSQ